MTAAISSPRDAEGLLDGVGIVERQRDGGLGEGLRDARRVGDAERRHAGAGLDEQRIDVAVVAAFEFDDAGRVR